MKEKDLYPQIVNWLLKFLRSYYKKGEITVGDTHKINLSDFLVRIGMQDKFPNFNVFDIKVDITGIIIRPQKADLAFVECKLNPIRLLDVGQLLGYSLVAKPVFSYLLSPKGVSDPLHNLLKVYGRHDILKYSEEHTLRIAKWDIQKEEPIWSTLIPAGAYLRRIQRI